MIIQTGKGTGECFIEEGLITASDMKKVLLLQRKGRISLGSRYRKLFGAHLCDLKRLDPIRNYYFLHKYNKLFRLDHFLSFHNILSPEMIRTADARSENSNTPLLSTLLDLEMVTKSQLKTLVQELYHLPFMFISPRAFEASVIQALPFQFSREEARGKKMIPLMIKDRTVVIGITDPENLLSVYQLTQKFSNLKFVPVFILFSCFHRVFRHLYEKDVNAPKPDLSLLLNSKITISDPETEPASIAALYSRCKLLKGLNGQGKKRDSMAAFKKNIFREHQKLTRHHGCRSIDYLFRKQKNQVKLIAVPKK